MGPIDNKDYPLPLGTKPVPPDVENDKQKAKRRHKQMKKEFIAAGEASTYIQLYIN